MAGGGFGGRGCNGTHRALCCRVRSYRNSASLGFDLGLGVRSGGGSSWHGRLGEAALLPGKKRRRHNPRALLAKLMHQEGEL